MFRRYMHDKYRLPDRRLVTIEVLYYIPKSDFILQQFFWQTEDEIPRLPRIHRFLSYWQSNIDAVIKDVSVCNAGNTVAAWRHGTLYQT